MEGSDHRKGGRGGGGSGGEFKKRGESAEKTEAGLTFMLKRRGKDQLGGLAEKRGKGELPKSSKSQISKRGWKGNA